MSADFSDVVTSLAAVERINDQTIPYFTFGIPQPIAFPPNWTPQTAVFYVDLRGDGAEVIISLVKLAYQLGSVLYVSLDKNPNVPFMTVSSVQFQKA